MSSDDTFEFGGVTFKNTDDKLKELVEGFAKALLTKLIAAEMKYGWNNGWAKPDWEDDCRRHLLEHVAKGDPLDVAAYAAFCWHHGWGTSLTKPPFPGNKQPPASDVVTQITTARSSVYGPFLHNAIVAQNIKKAMRGIPDPNNDAGLFDDFPADIKEGLELIALKISRILTGDPEYLDNWDDIAGYAKCVADRIRRGNLK